MDTFELLPSLAQGELAETSAPELVAAVFRSRASGTLWMEVDDTEIRCFFRAGDMCGTGPFQGFQTLAHVLLANDWVAALEIESSHEEASGKGLRHGEVLVQRKLLTPDQLRTALGAQHTANLTTLLCLTQGKYDWRGWEPPPAWAREVVVDPISCVIDALEMEQHAARRGKIIAFLGRNPARLSHDWPELQERVNLAPLDRRAAALLALPRRLEEFVQASRLAQTRAEALLAGLMLAGGVEPQPQASAPPPAPAARKDPPSPARKEPAAARKEPPAPSRREAPAPQRKDPPAPPRKDPPRSVPAMRNEPQRKAPAPRAPEPLDAELELQSLEPEPLEEPFLEPLPEDGPLEEDEPFAEPPAGTIGRIVPKRVAVDESEALARLDSLSLDDEFSPPAAGPGELADEPLEIDDRPRYTPGVDRGNPAFGRPDASGSDAGQSRDLRKKMMAQGLRNLGGMVQPPSDPSGAVREEELGREPLDESRLSPEDLRFVDEVRSRARLAQRQDAYARLGLAVGATSEQIKSAYLGLAKRFHPDRASGPDLSALQPELQALFGQLKESYDAISTAEARARYDGQAKASGNKAGSRKEEAGLALKMGEVLFKKRDFENAIQKLRRAVDLEASGDALAALAWALVADPKSSAATKDEAASLINRALRAPGVTARTYYVAGVLWRTKDPDSAVDAFRKALQLEPGHSDAALELRLIEARRGKQGKAGGGVLSGLLFGSKRKT